MRKLIAATVVALGIAVGIGAVVMVTSSQAGPTNCKNKGTC